MLSFPARSLARSAFAGAALSLATQLAWAGFVLTPDRSVVARGSSFQVTLSYDGAEALNWALDVTPLSASLPGLTLTGLTPRVSGLNSVLVGPTDPPLALPAFISAFLDGPVGGGNASVELWQFELAVDADMALGAVTLLAQGAAADNDFNEILYEVSAPLRIVDGGGGPLPEGGTLPSVALALAALALVRRALRRTAGAARPACATDR